MQEVITKKDVGTYYLLCLFPEINKKPTYDREPKHNHALEILFDKTDFTRPRRVRGQRAAIE